MVRRKLLGALVAALVLALAGVAFAQLPPGGTFTDDNGNPHEPNIEAIAAAGITQGCSPTLFCPGQNVTRAEMAAFLLRGAGEGANLPSFQGYFPDVPPDQWFTPWVERLFELGISVGYPDGTYRPISPVTRAEMSAFILRTVGQTENLSPYRGLFSDVPQSAWYALLAERLHDLGITTGCATGPLRYCPDQPVKRDQMASFLARTFGLAPIVPPPPPTTTTTVPGEFASFTVSGSGNDVLDFQIPGDAPAVLEITHNGSSNFIVWSLDSSFSEIDLLVNEIGFYSGRRMVHGGWFSSPELVRHLEITANGTWSITALPMSAATPMTTSLSGNGDNIIRYLGSASTLTSTHNGSSNFIIWGYQSNGKITGLIVNEIGSYSGTDLIDSGTAIFDIQADGNWTLTAP